MIPKDLLPCPILRVGVTGRRVLTVALHENGSETDSICDVTEKIRLMVCEVLEEIQKAARREFHVARRFYQEGPPEFGVVSPLAEGSDRIFAEEAIKLGYRLECPLPFHRAEYANDFKAPGSKERFYELLGYAGEAVLELNGQREPRAAREAAYENVGRLVVDHCDLLVAIWDGKQDSGPGGTNDIIKFSLGRVPVISLRMDSDLHLIHLHRGKSHQEAYSQEAIGRLVKHVVSPPEFSDDREGNQDITGDYIDALPTGTSILGWLWGKFIWSMLLGKKLPSAGSHRVPDGAFLRYYERFDAYANRLSGLYRGAFLLNYTLGVGAVIVALLGHLAGLFNLPHSIELGFVVAEFIAILVIISLLFLLGQQRWHYRSVDCRYLAEQFRVLCYIYPLGLAPPHPRLPAHHVHHDVQKSWMEWLLRGIFRQHRRSQGIVGSEEVETQRKRMIDWVYSQIRYHERNARRMELIEGRLHKLIWSSLFVILLACCAHFGLKSLYEKSPDTEKALGWWLTALAAGLPALSAACHAIATQGEFERLAERGKAMSESLERLAKSLRDMNTAAALTLGELREECRVIAELVVEEVVDWQILYRKPVPPP